MAGKWFSRIFFSLGGTFDGTQTRVFEGLFVATQTAGPSMSSPHKRKYDCGVISQFRPKFISNFFYVAADCSAEQSFLYHDLVALKGFDQHYSASAMSAV